MESIRRVIVGGAFATLGTCAWAAPPQYALDFTISRDGKVVTAPSLVVDAGKQAEFVSHDKANPRSNVRMQVTAEAAPKKSHGKDVVRVDMSLFENIDGQWVVRAKPEIAAYEGEPAIMTLAANGATRNAHGYRIELVARSVTHMPTGD